MARIKNTNKPTTGRVIPVHEGRGRITRASTQADDCSFLLQCATEYARQRTTTSPEGPRTMGIDIRLTEDGKSTVVRGSCPRKFRPYLATFMRKNAIRRVVIATERHDGTEDMATRWTTALAGYKSTTRARNMTPHLGRLSEFVSPA